MTSEQTRATALPFRIPESDADPIRRRLAALARPLLERALAFHRLNRMYARLAAARPDPRHFADRALEALDIKYEVAAADLDRIPREGPLLVVANHPFGGADGLILLSMLRRVRPDVKVLGNSLLRPIPDLRDSFFFVDAFGGGEARRRNVGPMRRALRWLKEGGLLAVFPAGEVSHATFGRRRVADPAWGAATGRLAMASRAPVVPVCFEGRNGALFQMAGLLHPRLRTALLPRELLRRRGATVRLHVGGPIRPARIQRLGEPERVTEYLRLRTEILGCRGAAGEPAARRPAGVTRTVAAPIAAAPPAGTLAREVASLPAGSLLLASGPYDVLHARADRIPGVLREIGRLREVSFRGAGEGTGRAIDLDRFDRHYLHLFVWNRERLEVVGAYRIGPTDEILPRAGVEGLYTSTLFRYQQRLLDRITPALELGRSFVRPEYQKEPQPLALLWKGIGRFVAAHPRYRRLFGPVSISNRYHSMSRRLLMLFLRMNRYLGDLAVLIEPRHAPDLEAAGRWDERLLATAVDDLDEVNDLIAEIESDRKSMPVLLRQYLKLDARLLGFNVDPEFGDVLDGLVLIDLTRVDRAILARYMGRENAEAFLARHGRAF